ncbi:MULTISPECIES: UvrD-helicase domain-containing protein [unclassified Massilia]|uniref:UvrD-helicase domain-containing protein n=1 Tax=unclassified Massilia TaxID=2609279 RepID=UPI000B1C5ACF|nr:MULTISPECIES: UvrD-helicase domain-containing protein [unclassified Massilia]
MSNIFVFAGAGTGKTERIVTEAMPLLNSSKRVLVLTYTENNQREVYSRFSLRHRGAHPSFTVKGLLTFYLDEIIRPYQRALFSKRIEGFILNDSDPHKRNGKNIAGRTERLADGAYNPLYYLTPCQTKAHSALLAKLACAVIKETKGAPVRRLGDIYDNLYFDECQDMVGWDFEVLSLLTKSKRFFITCVGDFRQTIYETACTTKKPSSSVEKVGYLEKLKFIREEMTESYRSIQQICDYAGRLHAAEGYPTLVSHVVAPEEFKHHQGVFVVKQSDARLYLNRYEPVLLRHSVKSGTEYDDLSLRRMTFGKSKGLGFTRTAIIPTSSHLKFLQGDATAFGLGKTEEPRNRFYVALTRAKYSVALIVPDTVASACNIPTWNPIDMADEQLD